MRFFAELLAILIIGLGLGGALAWVSIQKNQGFGAVKIGQWTAWPFAGSKDADPYTKAKVAAAGEVPLGAAEGVAFYAPTDENDKQLQRNCRYLISGQTPPARLWTISAHDKSNKPLFNNVIHASSLLSQNLIRSSNGQFSIYTGPQMAEGNWLQTAGIGEYQLILRLYDTPITSANKIVDPHMPTIKLLSCAQ